MARQILGGPTDDGRSSYPISLHGCAACGGGLQVAGGESIAIDRAVVEMAACDAQQLGSAWRGVARWGVGASPIARSGAAPRAR